MHFPLPPDILTPPLPGGPMNERTTKSSASSANPLEDLDHWEEFLETRYPDPATTPPSQEKKASEFRDYRKNARPSVTEFYRLNHAHQTYDFVQQKKRQYL